MITLQQENIIKETVSRYSPVMVGIFGSYARNEQTGNSDLDILVDFNQRVHLLDLIGLEQELSELLGIKVDIVTSRSVHRSLASYIQKDLVRIL